LVRLAAPGHTVPVGLEPGRALANAPGSALSRAFVRSACVRDGRAACVVRARASIRQVAPTTGTAAGNISRTLSERKACGDDRGVRAPDVAGVVHAAAACWLSFFHRDAWRSGSLPSVMCRLGVVMSSGVRMRLRPPVLPSAPGALKPVIGALDQEPVFERATEPKMCRTGLPVEALADTPSSVSKFRRQCLGPRGLRASPGEPVIGRANRGGTSPETGPARPARSGPVSSCRMEGRAAGGNRQEQTVEGAADGSLVGSGRAATTATAIVGRRRAIGRGQLGAMIYTSSHSLSAVLAGI